MFTITSSCVLVGGLCLFFSQEGFNALLVLTRAVNGSAPLAAFAWSDELSQLSLAAIAALSSAKKAYDAFADNSTR